MGPPSPIIYVRMERKHDGETGGVRMIVYLFIFYAKAGLFMVFLSRYLKPSLMHRGYRLMKVYPQQYVDSSPRKLDGSETRSQIQIGKSSLLVSQL